MREFREYRCDPCDLTLKVEANKDRIRRCLNGNPPRCPACTKPVQFVTGGTFEPIPEPPVEFPGVADAASN